MFDESPCVSFFTQLHNTLAPVARKWVGYWRLHRIEGASSAEQGISSVYIFLIGHCQWTKYQ